MNPNNKVKNQMNQLMPVMALALTLLNLTACGKTAFTVVPGSQNLSAPGSFSIPPKVDILLIESDKGRMFEAWSQASTQMPAFLSKLDQQGWDYHFAVMPLTTSSNIQNVTASKYDGNYGANWVAPYPGAAQFTSDSVLSSFFQLPSTFSGWLSESQVSNTLNGYEPGFQTIEANLSNGLGNSHFLRSDALFVPLIVSLGDDTSGVNFCSAPDSTANYTHMVPCEQVPNPEKPLTSTSSLNQSEKWFKNFKANTQVYAAVAAKDSSNCLGGSASAGSRYEKLAADSGGKSYDICSQPMSQILSTLAGDLQSKKIGYRQHYIFIAGAPNPSSIVVTLHKGDGSGTVYNIPQDPNNGWSYAGNVSNVDAIDYPVAMNQSSGYAIELNGNAEISGNDWPSVTYTPAGAQNSVSN